MRTLSLLVVASFVPASAWAQDASSVRRMFEAGQYQQVVDSAAGADPAVQYTAAQSYQKLGAPDRAIEVYRQVSSLPEDNPWHFVGLSAQQLLENQSDAALASAQQAVSLDGNLPEAHYQLGLVYAERQAAGEAAAAFDRAAELDPSYAYAHYYAGLMYSRANRTDRMAMHFEQFLRLAPEAPERPTVMQVMRRVRGQ